jgi:hypothetical protein
VKLVHEEDDLTRCAAHLLHHALHPLLELTAVLGAGDESGEVERHDPLVLERLRHVIFDDALGQPLSDGGLADARLAHQTRVVLGATREDVDDALDLVVATDAGVHFLVAGQLGQVAPELVQGRRAGAVLRLRLLGLALLHGVDLPAGPLQVRAELHEDAGSEPVVFADETEQQVLRADVVVRKRPRLFIGKVDHPLRARGELHILAQIAGPTGDLALYLTADATEGDPQTLQDARGDGVVLAHQAEEQMFRADVTLAESRGLFLSEEDHAPGSLGEPLPHVP